MDAAFWHRAWSEGRTGFHRGEVSPQLSSHGDRFLSDGPHRVLVPLCGKSLDLLWFRDQGHHVVGVELVETAIRALHEAHGIEARQEAVGDYVVWKSEGLEIWHGDVLGLDASTVGSFSRIWDRAANIALPAGVRERYVTVLRSLLATHGRLLLSTLSYPQDRVQGPPFSVEPDEVHRAYEGFQVEVLDQRDDVPGNARFVDAGIESWRLTNYLIERTA